MYIRMADRSDMDYYGLLGLPHNASQKEIRDAYRCQVSTCHPDKFQDPEQKKLAEERIKQVNEAYETLGDVSLRNAYDYHRDFQQSRQTKPYSPPIHPTPRTVTHKQTWVDPSPYHPFHKDRHNPPVSPLESAYPDFLFYQTRHSSPSHYVFLANSNDHLQVFLNHSATLFLLDELNYAQYQSTQNFNYWGGKALFSPTYLRIPFSGQWHLLIEPLQRLNIFRAKVILIPANR
jgi:curved DNA-binding protein CbpA